MNSISSQNEIANKEKWTANKQQWNETAFKENILWIHKYKGKYLFHLYLFWWSWIRGKWKSEQQTNLMFTNIIWNISLWRLVEYKPSLSSSVVWETTHQVIFITSNVKAAWTLWLFLRKCYTVDVNVIHFQITRLCWKFWVNEIFNRRTLFNFQLNLKFKWNR